MLWLSCYTLVKQNKSVHPIFLQNKALNKGIGSLQDNLAHRNIREGLLGSTRVGIFPGIINRCTLGLANQQARSYAYSAELELIVVFPFTSGELVWHLITQVNDSLLAACINIFDLRNDNHRSFIYLLVYALFYLIIAINLVTLAILSPLSDSVYTHT